MKIGLFFGSFNPVHLGHTRLAEYILRHAGQDEVWLMVSPNNPLKAASSLLDEHVRYRMAVLATEDIEGLRASDFEFGLPRPSYTISTLRALSAAHPEDEFALIIGSDNMALFDRWRDYDLILRDYSVLVYPREGDDIEGLRRKYPTMKVVEGAPLLPISATEIRQKIRQGTYDERWLDPKVLDFLKKNTNLFADINNIS